MNARNEMLGIIDGMPAEDYFAAEGVNNSLLKDMAKSPAHCFALHLAPDRPMRKATPAMMAGTLAHTAILEPDTLKARYVVKPAGIDGRTKEGKEWDACHAGFEIITEDRFETCKAQRAAVMAHPQLAPLFASGVAEQSAFWRDAATGLICKARGDWRHTLDDGRLMLVDLKTTTDASPDAFARTVWNFGYHRQGAHYTSGFEAASGLEVAGFVFAVVTNDYPYIAAAHMLDEDYQRLGADECRTLLDDFAECRRKNSWPGFSSMNLLQPPAWARKSEDEIEVAYVV